MSARQSSAVLNVPGRDERHVFSAQIRHETETGWLILPRGSRDPLWLQRRLTQIGDVDALGFHQFVIPKWLARAKGIVAGG
jgi:hypothetical protein